MITPRRSEKKDDNLYVRALDYTKKGGAATKSCILDFDSLNARRVRMQNLSSASFYAGWISEALHPVLRVILSTEKPLAVGDFLAIEAEGPSNLLSFMGYCTEVEAEFVSVQLASEVSRGPLPSESRIALGSLLGEVDVEGAAMMLMITDASNVGFGGYVERKLGIGAEVTVRLTTPFGPVSCLSEVRHCRPSKRDPNSKRIGFRIRTMDRVSTARWHRLLLEL